MVTVSFRDSFGPLPGMYCGGLAMQLKNEQPCMLKCLNVEKCGNWRTCREYLKWAAARKGC